MPAARRFPMHRTSGFTLIELVVTITILGIIAAVVAVFLQRPVEGYVATARRATLVDAADFVLRRIARDLATAAPNTARSDGTRNFLELLQTRSGGRYCNAADCGDALLDGDTHFRIIGSLLPGSDFVAGDTVLIGSLSQANASCYAYNNLYTVNGNTRLLNFAGSNATTIGFSGSAYNNTCAEVTRRFLIVSGPVSYACDGATGTLWRYSGYAIQAAQPATIATLDGLATVKSPLATNVNCAGTQLDASNASTLGAGLVELRIQLTDASTETVVLYRQVLVDNAP